MGFHAPQEAARILAESIDYARQGQAAAQRVQLQHSGGVVAPAPDAGVGDGGTLRADAGAPR